MKGDAVHPASDSEGRRRVVEDRIMVIDRQTADFFTLDTSADGQHVAVRQRGEGESERGFAE